jgi:hypothetical protein
MEDRSAAKDLVWEEQTAFRPNEDKIRAARVAKELCWYLR